LTDSQGRTVDFKNTVIIMTSNVGAKHLRKDNASLGFLADEKSNNEAENAKNRVMEEVKRTFRPEFINRVDELMVFSSLSDTELTSIVDIMLQEVNKRLHENHLSLECSDRAKAELVKEGRDYAYGARPLRRAIQKLVEDEIAELMLRRQVLAGDTILLDADDQGKVNVVKKQ